MADAKQQEKTGNNINDYLIGTREMGDNHTRDERRKRLIGILLRPIGPLGTPLQFGKPCPGLIVVVT